MRIRTAGRTGLDAADLSAVKAAAEKLKAAWGDIDGNMNEVDRHFAGIARIELNRALDSLFELRDVPGAWCAGGERLKLPNVLESLRSLAGVSHPTVEDCQRLERAVVRLAGMHREPLYVTAKEIEWLAGGTPSVKRMHNAKSLPVAVGKRGRESVYNYREVMAGWKWSPLPSEDEARKIIESQ